MCFSNEQLIIKLMHVIRNGSRLVTTENISKRNSLTSWHYSDVNNEFENNKYVCQVSKISDLSKSIFRCEKRAKRAIQKRKIFELENQNFSLVQNRTEQKEGISLACILHLKRASFFSNFYSNWLQPTLIIANEWSFC